MRLRRKIVIGGCAVKRRHLAALPVTVAVFAACSPPQATIYAPTAREAVTTIEPPTVDPPTTVAEVVVPLSEPRPEPPTDPPTSLAQRPTTTAVLVPQAVDAPRVVDQPTDGVWPALAECESGDTNADTGNGFYGYWQWSAATWHAMGYDGLPTEYGYDFQLAASQRLQREAGWGQWPGCSRALGLS